MDRILFRRQWMRQFSPIARLPAGTPSIWACSTPSRTKPLLATSSPTASFSTSRSPQAKAQAKPDKRIAVLRYHLYHPKVPRPLRFSRLRALRHWTIHRAWQLHRAKLRRAQEVELEKQWRCMREACEELRLIGADGCRVEEGGSARDLGLLFRSNYARERQRLVPIEYARVVTDWPSREGWNEGWKKGR